MRTPELSTPYLREIILTPVEIASATDVPILDEFGNIILDELGNSIYEN